MAAKRKSAKKPASKAAAKRAPAKKVAPKKPSARVAADGPSLFRVNVEVGNLDEAERFYGELLGQKGRRQRGARVYFDAGPVTLQIVDVASMGMACRIRPRRRSISSCAITVRAWGERSFYAEDRWPNPLCFVEEGTTYPG